MKPLRLRRKHKHAKAVEEARAAGKICICGFHAETIGEWVRFTPIDEDTIVEMPMRWQRALATLATFSIDEIESVIEAARQKKADARMKNQKETSE